MNKKTVLITICLMAVTAFTGLITVSAEYTDDYGSLSGYVTDPTGFPISNALVRVSFHGTYEEDYTDSNGYYHVTDIPICYCMKNATASKDGYETETVWLSISGDDTYDFELEPVWLSADSYEISASSVDTITFNLNAGVENANRNYILLGCISGTEPGIPLPGGQAVLPLNWDSLTTIIYQYANTQIFDEFIGQLDENGQANAYLSPYAIELSNFVGTKIYFAYCCNNPFDFASNPVVIEIVE